MMADPLNANTAETAALETWLVRHGANHPEVVRYIQHLETDLVDARQKVFHLRRVISSHYPTIAGHVLRLQEAHEERGAAEWLAVAQDFHAAIGKDSPPVSAASPVSPAKVLEAVAQHYGVAVDDLKAKGRVQRIIEPRQAAMYLLQTDLGLSTPEIGRLLNRDHTTVLYGTRQIEEAIARGGPTYAAVCIIRRSLQRQIVPS